MVKDEVWKGRNVSGVQPAHLPPRCGRGHGLWAGSLYEQNQAGQESAIRLCGRRHNSHNWESRGLLYSTLKHWVIRGTYLEQNSQNPK